MPSQNPIQVGHWKWLLILLAEVELISGSSYAEAEQLSGTNLAKRLVVSKQGWGSDGRGGVIRYP